MTNQQSTYTINVGGNTAGAQQAFQALSGSVNQLTQGAMSPLTGMTSQVSNSFRGMLSGAQSLEFGMVTLAAAAAGVTFELGAVGAKFDTQLMQIAATLGISTERALFYSNALQDVGGNQEVLVRAGVQLSTVIQTAADAQDKGNAVNDRAKVIIDQLGISIRDVNGNIRGQGEVLDDVLQKLGNMANKSDAARLASELFGYRLGGQLVPFIVNYSQVSEVAQKQTDAFGNSVDDAGKRAIGYHTQLTNVKNDLAQLGHDAEGPATGGLKILHNELETIDNTLAHHDQLQVQMTQHRKDDLQALNNLINDPIGVLTFKHKQLQEAQDKANMSLTVLIQGQDAIATATAGAVEPVFDLSAAWDNLTKSEDNAAASAKNVAKATTEVLDVYGNPTLDVLEQNILKQNDLKVQTDRAKQALLDQGYTLEGLPAHFNAATASMDELVKHEEEMLLTQQRESDARKEAIKILTDQGIVLDGLGKHFDASTASMSELIAHEKELIQTSQREAEARKIAEQQLGIYTETANKAAAATTALNTATAPAASTPSSGASTSNNYQWPKDPYPASVGGTVGSLKAYPPMVQAVFNLNGQQIATAIAQPQGQQLALSQRGV